MNDNRFEPAFSREFRKRQNKFSLKYYGIILPIVMTASLYALYRVYGPGALTYIMQGITILLCSCIWFLDIRYRCWLAQSFQLTEAGIVIKSWCKKERSIPWSSVVAVDKGGLSGYDSQSISVIRCFLSASAWEKMVSSLKKSTISDSPNSYLSLRKSCIVIEYSGEIEQTIAELWGSVNESVRDKNSSSNKFEYTFSEGLRSRFYEIKDIYVLVYYVLVLSVYLVLYLKNGHLSKDALGFACLFLGTPLVFMLVFKSGQDCTQWIMKSKCRLCGDGIYLKSARGKVEYIPWSNVAFAERRKMNIDAATTTDVICCYRSLTGKALLDRAAKQAVTHTMHREYYHLRDEIVTIGYTGSRMGKIRKVCKDSPWQK